RESSTRRTDTALDGNSPTTAGGGSGTTAADGNAGSGCTRSGDDGGSPRRTTVDIGFAKSPSPDATRGSIGSGGRVTFGTMLRGTVEDSNVSRGAGPTSNTIRTIRTRGGFGGNRRETTPTLEITAA